MTLGLPGNSTVQNIPLTRYQLLRTFLYVVCIAWFVVWFLTVPEQIFINRAIFTYAEFPHIRIASLLSPVALLLVWPLLPVLIRALAGRPGDGTITSTRDLRPLLLPCLGMILFLMALAQIGFEIVNQYDMAQIQRQYLSDGPSDSAMYALSDSEEFDFRIIDWLMGLGSSYIQSSLLLFIGIQVIAYRFIRSRPNVVAPVPPASSLTRFELMRAFIYLVLLSTFVSWLIVTSFEVASYIRHGFELFAMDGLFELGGPLVVLLLLPFVSTIAHAMTGEDERELVEFFHQLRSLMLPCIGFFIFVWVLREAPSSIWFAYDETVVSGATLSLWEWYWKVPGWPVVNCSVGLGLMLYPSVREMVKGIISR